MAENVYTLLKDSRISWNPNVVISSLDRISEVFNIAKVRLSSRECTITEFNAGFGIYLEDDDFIDEGEVDVASEDALIDVVADWLFEVKSLDELRIKYQLKVHTFPTSIELWSAMDSVNDHLQTIIRRCKNDSIIRRFFPCRSFGRLIIRPNSPKHFSTKALVIVLDKANGSSYKICEPSLNTIFSGGLDDTIDMLRVHLLNLEREYSKSSE